MTALLIDIATTHGLVAILDETEVASFQYFPAAFETSRLLMPTIDELMKPYDVHSLDYIAVGRGPGSYTGVRIAAALASAIGIAAKVPLVGVSSLRAFVPKGLFSGPFFAAIDAKIGGIYLAEGICEEGRATFISDDALVPIEEAGKKITTRHLVVTPVAQTLALRLTNAKIVERKPSPEFLAQLAFAAFCRGEVALDGMIELSYLRRTQAEIEKDSAGKKG